MPIFIFFKAPDGYSIPITTELEFTMVNFGAAFGDFEDTIDMANANATTIPLPVAYWSLDNADFVTIGGSDIAIDSVSGINLTNAAGASTGSIGQVNQAFDYDGTASAYSGLLSNVPSSLLLNDYTYSGWVYIDSLAFVRCMLGIGEGATGDQAIIFNTDGSIGFITYYGNLLPAGYTSAASTVTTGQWYHVAMVRDSSSLLIKGYLNGVLLGSSSTVAATAWYASSPPADVELTVGARPSGGGGTQNMDGRVDEVAIWNTAFTDEQVFEIYSQGATNQKLIS